eukprot:10000319-Heterocapsa_arctica.AAC.1
MWPAEPSVGRFGLPEEFGESTHGAQKLKERYMIYDPRVCDMPRSVAFRDEKYLGDGGKSMDNASRKMSKLL